MPLRPALASGSRAPSSLIIRPAQPWLPTSLCCCPLLRYPLQRQAAPTAVRAWMCRPPSGPRRPRASCICSRDAAWLSRRLCGWRLEMHFRAASPRMSFRVRRFSLSPLAQLTAFPFRSTKARKHICASLCACRYFEGYAFAERHCAGAAAAVPLSRWDTETSPPESAVVSARFGGFLAGIDSFDAGLFGVSAPEAVLMDPQQRLLLTHAYQVRNCVGFKA